LRQIAGDKGGDNGIGGSSSFWLGVGVTMAPTTGMGYLPLIATNIPFKLLAIVNNG
jgi:hypothetical protein